MGIKASLVTLHLDPPKRKPVDPAGVKWNRWNRGTSSTESSTRRTCALRPIGCTTAHVLLGFKPRVAAGFSGSERRGWGDGSSHLMDATREQIHGRTRVTGDLAFNRFPLFAVMAVMASWHVRLPNSKAVIKSRGAPICCGTTDQTSK